MPPSSLLDANTRLRINDPALSLAATKGYHVVLSDDVAPHMNHLKKNVLSLAQPAPIENRATPPQKSGHPGTYLSYIWSDIPFFNANLTTGVQVNQTLNANGLRVELSPPKSLASPWLDAALLRFEAHEFVPESLRLVRAGGTSIQEARLNGYEFGASVGLATAWPSRLASEAKLLVCVYCMRREELSLFEPTLGGATADQPRVFAWELMVAGDQPPPRLSTKPASARTKEPGPLSTSESRQVLDIDFTFRISQQSC